MRYLLIIVLCCSVALVSAGNTGINSGVVNTAVDIYGFVTDDNINVTFASGANAVHVESVQTCTAQAGSVCQNASGVAITQSVSRSSSNGKKKIVHGVNSQGGYVHSYSKQTTKNKDAQNCAAVSCIQVLEE